jgi:hypothetical protein
MLNNNTTTARQFGLIIENAKKQGISETEIKETISKNYGCGIWELSRNEASKVIGDLGYNPPKCPCKLCYPNGQ